MIAVMIKHLLYNHAISMVFDTVELNLKPNKAHLVIGIIYPCLICNGVYFSNAIIRSVRDGAVNFTCSFHTSDSRILAGYENPHAKWGSGAYVSVMLPEITFVGTTLVGQDEPGKPRYRVEGWVP